MAGGDLVSIVMPAYNCEAFISQSVASVLAQTYQRWELIVVDDCSSDRTVALARELGARDPRVAVERMPSNSGSSAARNAGIRFCSGRYVAFLDADDIWLPEKLERQVDFACSSGAAFTFTAYRKLGSSGPSGVIHAPAHVSWLDMLKGNRIGCSTVMLDRHEYPQLAFPTGLGRQEDYALWLSLIRTGGSARGLNEPLVLYRVHAASKSARKLRSVTAQWRVYREFERLSMPRSAWYMGHYAVRGLVKSLR